MFFLFHLFQVTFGLYNVIASVVRVPLFRFKGKLWITRFPSCISGYYTIGAPGVVFVEFGLIPELVIFETLYNLGFGVI